MRLTSLEKGDNCANLGNSAILSSGVEWRVDINQRPRPGRHPAQSLQVVAMHDPVQSIVSMSDSRLPCDPPPLFPKQKTIGLHSRKEYCFNDPEIRASPVPKCPMLRL